MRLSEAQERAYYRMIDRQKKRGKKWSTAYDVGAQMRTIQSLIEKGAIEAIPSPILGSSFSPRTTLRYKAKENALRQ